MYHEKSEKTTKALQLETRGLHSVLDPEEAPHGYPSEALSPLGHLAAAVHVRRQRSCVSLHVSAPFEYDSSDYVQIRNHLS